MTGRGGRRGGGPARGGNHHHRHHNSNSRNNDITGILTFDEKQGLIDLVCDSMARIDHQIFDKFETTPAPIPAENPQHTLLAGPLKTKNISCTESQPPVEAAKPPPIKENKPPIDNTAQCQNGTSMLYSKAHKVLGSKQEPRATGDQCGEKEQFAVNATIGPTHSELKKELRLFFERWQNTVSLRIKDLSVQQSHVSDSAATRGGRGRGGRGGRGSRGGRGGRGESAPIRGHYLTGGTSNVRGRGGGAVGRGSAQTTASSQPDPHLASRFPPTNTWLRNLPLERRRLILHLTMLNVISLDVYPSFSRILMVYVTSSLHLPLKDLQDNEVRLGRGFGKAVENLNLDFVIQQRTTESKKSRKWKAAGASLLAPAGTLPESLIAAGLGSIPGTPKIGHAVTARLMGDASHNGIVVGNMLGLYAGRELGKMVDQYGKDSADFAFLPIKGNTSEPYRDARAVSPSKRKMRLVVGVVGWITQERGHVEPFQCLAGPNVESYALRYESENLTILGTNLETIIFKSALWRTVKTDMVHRNVLSCLIQRKWPLGLVRLNKMLDNPWNVCMVRTERAGMALAECIGRKVQGDRPISLIGYGLGARAIYLCLTALAERRQFGLVESAVLMGAPAPADPRLWLNLTSAVVGRLVNVYSEHDTLLGFLCRHSNHEYGIAGLQAIQKVDGVENVNVTNFISGHVRYQYEVGRILKEINWEDMDAAQVVEDEALLEKKDKKVRRKKPPVSPHLPVDKTLRPFPNPKEVNSNAGVKSPRTRKTRIKN